MTFEMMLNDTRAAEEVRISPFSVHFNACLIDCFTLGRAGVQRRMTQCTLRARAAWLINPLTRPHFTLTQAEHRRLMGLLNRRNERLYREYMRTRAAQENMRPASAEVGTSGGNGT